MTEQSDREMYAAKGCLYGLVLGTAGWAVAVLLGWAIKCLL